MRVCYQSIQPQAGDWLEIDSSKWNTLSSFDVMAVCVQGVVFEGYDHYTVEDLGSGEIDVAVWNDDPNDWAPGTRWAKIIRFRPLAPDPRPEYGGAINTNITQTIYAENENLFRKAHGTDPRVLILPWLRFDSASRQDVQHGKWATDVAYEAHQKSRKVAGWRGWTEGLDPLELNSKGEVRNQRSQGRYLKPKGTQTFYHNTANEATTAHSAQNENALGLSPGGVGSEDDAGVGTGGGLSWAGATPPNRPRTTAWPTTGVYRYQIDMTAAGADLTYGLLTQGGGVGHFGRVDSGLIADQETFVQDQSAFSSTGLNIASVTNPAWTSGAESDRFEILLASVRIIGHGNQTLTMQLGETDDFADGPWAEIVEENNATFFGCNF